MLPRFIIAAVLAPFIAAGAAIGAIVASGWTETHSTTGIVNASTVPDLLLICQPTGPNPDPCPGDNSGADETIFSADEGLLPGGPPATQLIRLVNVRSDVQWDISAVNVALTKTADPSGACTSTPSYSISTVTRDDDHEYDLAQGTPPQPFFHALDFNSGRYVYRIHVAPGGYDDEQIQVSLPGDFPVECAGAAWQINIDWTAEIH